MHLTRNGPQKAFEGQSERSFRQTRKDHADAKDKISKIIIGKSQSAQVYITPTKVDKRSNNKRLPSEKSYEPSEAVLKRAMHELCEPGNRKSISSVAKLHNIEPNRLKRQMRAIGGVDKCRQRTLGENERLINSLIIRKVGNAAFKEAQVLSDADEKYLASFINKHAQRGHGVTKESFFRLLKEHATKSGSFDGDITADHVRGFMKR